LVGVQLQVLSGYFLIFKQVGELTLELLDFINQERELVGTPQLAPKLLVALFQRKRLY
jgi:hypothetical protein